MRRHLMVLLGGLAALLWCRRRRRQAPVISRACLADWLKKDARARGWEP